MSSGGDVGYVEQGSAETGGTVQGCRREGAAQDDIEGDGSETGGNEHGGVEQRRVAYESRIWRVWAASAASSKAGVEQLSVICSRRSGVDQHRSINGGGGHGSAEQFSVLVATPPEADAGEEDNDRPTTNAADKATLVQIRIQR